MSDDDDSSKLLLFLIGVLTNTTKLFWAYEWCLNTISDKYIGLFDSWVARKTDWRNLILYARLIEFTLVPQINFGCFKSILTDFKDFVWISFDYLSLKKLYIWFLAQHLSYSVFRTICIPLYCVLFKVIVGKWQIPFLFLLSIVNHSGRLLNMYVSAQ